MLFRFMISLFEMILFDLQIYPDGKGPWACKGFHLRIFCFEFGWNDESGWRHEFNMFWQESRLEIELIFGYKRIIDISLACLEDLGFSSFYFLGYLFLWNEED